MKEIMKLIRFDFITSVNSALPFFGGMLLICLIITAFGVFNPIFGVFLFISSAAFFAPAQNTANNPNFRRVRGILPVSRASFVRAEFTETIIALLVSELITLILMGISRLSKLYEIFPPKFEIFCKEIHTCEGINVFDEKIVKFVHLVIFVCALLIVQVTFINMRSAIEKHEHDIRNILLVFAVAIIAFIVSVELVLRKVIPPYDEWLFPSSAAGTWVWGIALNVAAVALSILFCRITVKKTADYEI
ncbi:hypothetical protein [Ruminococcus sp.]|uniref:hypothetical protein n=1 Tax=Ruminococcus sp. TaxID=41978 RepID=UPI001B52F38C|nr:hypothetical protein [Ruminococcus sp.]MBP5432061.1 hypothetical protein [Ruminococcus sp.]